MDDIDTITDVIAGIVTATANDGNSLVLSLLLLVLSPLLQMTALLVVLSLLLLVPVTTTGSRVTRSHLKKRITSVNL